jgi:hypothetical protein
MKAYLFRVKGPSVTLDWAGPGNIYGYGNLVGVIQYAIILYVQMQNDFRTGRIVERSWYRRFMNWNTRT